MDDEWALKRKLIIVLLVIGLSIEMWVLSIYVFDSDDDEPEEEKDYPIIQIEGKPGVQAGSYYFSLYLLNDDLNGIISLFNNPIYSGSWEDGEYYTHKEARDEGDDFGYADDYFYNTTTFIWNYTEVIEHEVNSSKSWGPLMGEDDYYVLVEEKGGRDKMHLVWSWVVDRWLVTAVEI